MNGEHVDICLLPPRWRDEPHSPRGTSSVIPVQCGDTG